MSRWGPRSASTLTKLVAAAGNPNKTAGENFSSWDELSESILDTAKTMTAAPASSSQDVFDTYTMEAFDDAFVARYGDDPKDMATRLGSSRSTRRRSR